MGNLNIDSIVITGAGGYLGKRIVNRAISRKIHVRAVVRPGSNTQQLQWVSSPLVELIECDLETQVVELSQIIGGEGTSRSLASAVIHTAGLMVGTEEDHSRYTVGITRRLLEAMKISGCFRLVHISSLSVYGFAALPDECQLDELTPIEPDLNERDSYCRAKCIQEEIILKMSQEGFIGATVLRPGVICGYERSWTSRLGIKIGASLLQFNKHGRLPLIFVDDCAEAAVLAAQLMEINSDVYLRPELANSNWGFEAINIVSEYQPEQHEYLQLLKGNDLSAVRFPLCIPWFMSKMIISSISMLKIFFPKLYRGIPLIFKKPAFDARMKGLRYSNFRLKDRLGWVQTNDTKSALETSWKNEVQNQFPVN